MVQALTAAATTQWRASLRSGTTELRVLPNATELEIGWQNAAGRDPASTIVYALQHPAPPTLIPQLQGQKPDPLDTLTSRASARVVLQVAPQLPVAAGQELRVVCRGVSASPASLAGLGLTIAASTQGTNDSAAMMSSQPLTGGAPGIELLWRAGTRVPIATTAMFTVTIQAARRPRTWSFADTIGVACEAAEDVTSSSLFVPPPHGKRYSGVLLGVQPTAAVEVVDIRMPLDSVLRDETGSRQPIPMSMLNRLTYSAVQATTRDLYLVTNGNHTMILLGISLSSRTEVYIGAVRATVLDAGPTATGMEGLDRRVDSYCQVLVPSYQQLCGVDGSECVGEQADKRLYFATAPLGFATALDAVKHALSHSTGTAWRTAGRRLSLEVGQPGNGAQPDHSQYQLTVDASVTECPGSACPTITGSGGARVTARCVGYVVGPSCMDQDQASFCAFGEADRCHQCFTGAVCPGGARAWPVAGYASLSEAQQPVACEAPVPQRCLGWNRSLGRSVCAEGYDDAYLTCTACVKGYYLESVNLCSKCPSNASMLSAVVPFVLLGAVLAGILAVQVIIVYAIVRRKGGTFKMGLRRSVEFVIWMAAALSTLIQISRNIPQASPVYIRVFFNSLKVFLLEVDPVRHTSLPPFFPDTRPPMALTVASQPVFIL